MDQKRIVIPGEWLSDDTALSGAGTYISGGKVFASVCGLLVQKGKLSVHPFSGPYMPKKNDLIIGYVTVVTSSNWIFDINCPYEGLLHVTEYPIRVPSEEMLQHFNIGDTVLLKVTDVNSEMKVELTYKDPICKKLTKGRLFEVPYSKVSRVIGRSDAMISMLKAKTGCDIFVGGNGRIWLDGESADMDILMSALSKIETEARLPDLTDAVNAFIDEKYAAIGRQAHGAVTQKRKEKDSGFVKSDSKDSADLKKSRSEKKEKPKKEKKEEGKREEERKEEGKREEKRKEKRTKKKAPKNPIRLTRDNRRPSFV